MRKKFLKKVVVIGLTALLSINFSQTAKAQILHENKETKHISSGVVHENIQRMTTSGWRNINVVRVDLTNPYANVRGIMNPSGLSYRDTVSNMVEKNGAVAGVNADYFSYSPLPHTVGGMINDGEMIVNPIEKAPYASPSIYIDNDNQAFIDYLDRRIVVKNLSQGKNINPYTVNKLADGFKNISLLNKHWGYKSVGNRFNKDMVEVVVSNGKVIDVRKNLPATDIPRDGFILLARGYNADVLSEFQIGDEVELEAGVTPSLDKIQFAIGGGSIILKDGNPTLTNIHSSGAHPRTGIGVNKDKTELILVTLDGRGFYKGMEQKQFGGLMKELGAHNALNLDGGGSTAMAIKEKDSTSAKVVNNPSGGSERKVVNGVGVFAKETPIEDLDSIEVSPESSPLVFKDTGKLIFVKAYDKHRNQLDMNSSEINYHVEGLEAEMDGNLFRPKETGKATITVKYLDKEDKIDLYVLDRVEHIDSYMKEIKASPGQKVEIANFDGYDGNGNKAKIYTEDLNLEVVGDIGKIEGKHFIAADKPASGFITVRYGNGLSNIMVSIAGREFPDKSDPRLPKESKLIDTKRKKVELDENSYSLGVVADPKGLNNLVNYDASKDIVDRVNKHQAALFLGGAGKNFTNRITSKAQFHGNNAYKINKFNDITILNLNTSKRGLRASNSQQWLNFKEDIKNIKTDNIIISMTRPVFGSGGFTDSLEANLFHDILKEEAKAGKSIFVVQGASYSKSEMKDGIRYIYVKTSEAKKPEDKYTIPILEFVYKDGILTYSLDDIFPKP